ncbi:SH3-like domain-containing protein [Rhodopila sp.]|uniref:SH3-like domain-containing protein n=1 Tax=Rhodopila sp. TaxID=2480087 RepID=UPI003D1362EC
MFASGDTVRVKDAWPEAQGPVHIRTPHYVRGAVGEVVRHLGDFPNPEDLAFARPAARLPLYHVRFRKGAIWNEPKADDELLVEIFEHWLERP